MAMPTNQRKDSLRTQVLAQRALLGHEQWAAEDRARTGAALERLRATAPGTVAVYVSRPAEPATQALIDALRALGTRVLLPVLRRAPDWGDFTDWAHMRASWGDIPEPTGPRLGAAELGRADVIVVSALAVGRDGSRLGTGGGWYDRALVHRRAGAPVVALTRAAEVHAQVPSLPHDVRVDAFVTELGWVDI